MSDTVFRVHPAIGIGRVGDSDEFYIEPVTAAGVKQPNGLMGGLPVKPGTEDTPITADDFRDKQGNVKRQAARFRIYAYPPGASDQYPTGGGELVKIGGSVGGKKVADIVWTVHLANKKLNNYSTVSKGNQFRGIGAYEQPNLLELRNDGYKGTHDKNDPVRLRELFIDPGPRAIKASGGTKATIEFDAATPAAYADSKGAIVPVPNYPKSFPADFNPLYEPLGELTTLGDISVDAGGGLIVAGGHAKVAAIAKSKGGDPVDPLVMATENGLWYDDAADGPVNAVIVFDDKSTAAVQAGWYVTGDPGYAPQTRNVVSVWDDVYDAWVRELDLVPELYSNGIFKDSYKPSFTDDIQPVFHAAMLQRWNTNLPTVAVNNHDVIGAIKPTDDPTSKIPNLATLLRNPTSGTQIETGSPFMPLSLGDAEKSFLTVSQTQYFLLNQWYAKTFLPGPGPKLGPGERLDRIVLENCLGGRYSPGIEVSFPIRDPNLYIIDWKKRDCGPFRINEAPLDYSKAVKDKPFLGFGYIPLQNFAVEPGDISKFMSVPWFTDYNSCGTHVPDPNPQGNNTLFWSWPADRPFSSYPVSLCSYDPKSKTWNVGQQVYCIRGPGTETPYPAQFGRYQQYIDFVKNWFKVGFIIEGPQIKPPSGKPAYPANIFLEVASGFDVGTDFVPPWPQADVPHYPGTPPAAGR
jgi:L-Lysine epsilon oxidase N-terminal/L-lysine epsilon oxidase C-terminal domain